MKIATVLSVSALLGLFSVVACSTPVATTASGEDESNAAATRNDEEETEGNERPATTTSDAGSTTTGGDEASACISCLAANTEYKKALDCEAKCGEDDGECVGKCYDAIGCTQSSADNVCAQQEEKCADKCQPSEAELAEYAQCLSSKNNTQVNAIEKCFEEADSQEAADACFDLKCDSKCDAAYEACGG